MAKDLEKEKKTPENAETKADKKSKDKKPAKKKKGIVKYFKDARAEFKKVVWPTPKETTKNTVVVLVMCILAGAIIFGLDSLFGVLNKLAFH